jgi:hypothetical protein
MLGIYPFDTALTSRSADVWIPGLAKAVGPEAPLRRRVGLAAQRLLACNVVVYRGLFST